MKTAESKTRERTAVTHVSAVEVKINITGDLLLGGQAKIGCSWVKEPNELLFKLVIKSQTGLSYYVYFLESSEFRHAGISDIPHKARLSLETASTSVTMNIRDLQCMDEQTYVCEMEFNYLHNTTVNDFMKTDSRSLTVKFPPSKPSLTTAPDSMSNGVVENTTVQVTCSANTGRTNYGLLAWKIYYGSQMEEITPQDPRITSVTNETLAQGEDPCTERKKSTFLITVNKAFDKLIIACFALNKDFVSTLPPFCDDKVKDICEQTSAIRVHHGVSKIKLTSEPEEELFVGGWAILICSSDGYPRPSYTWTKIGTANNSLKWQDDRDKSKLIFENLQEKDEGEYICRARNMVNGLSYSESGHFIFTLVMEKASSKSSSEEDDTITYLVLVTLNVFILLMIAVVVGCIHKEISSKMKKPPPKKEERRPIQTNLDSEGEKDQLSGSGSEHSEEDKNTEYSEHTFEDNKEVKP